MKTSVYVAVAAIAATAGFLIYRYAVQPRTLFEAQQDFPKADWTPEQNGGLQILAILKYQPKVMAPVSLEAMPQVTEEYSHMHPAKCSNFGTGVLTDF